MEVRRVEVRSHAGADRGPARFGRFADVSLVVMPNREVACAGDVLALLVRDRPNRVKGGLLSAVSSFRLCLPLLSQH